MGDVPVGRDRVCALRLAPGVVARQQELTAETLWTEVSGRLKGALNDTTFGTWFGDVSSSELTDESGAPLLRDVVSRRFRKATRISPSSPGKKSRKVSTLKIWNHFTVKPSRCHCATTPRIGSKTMG